MNMNYDPKTLQQGRMNQMQLEENPTSFATDDGSSQAQGTGRLDVTNQRMAGQEGARFVQMMLDPQERARTQRWMESFGLSNEGFQFNQAKMMMAGMNQPQGDQQQGGDSQNG